MQKLSDGAVIAGNYKVKGGSGGAAALLMMSGTVARTDTTPKNLFKLPKGAILDGILVGGTVASDAGTTAVLDVGKTGTQDFFVADHNIRAANNGDVTKFAVGTPTGVKNAGAQGEVQVTGTYAETGTASTTGGPWTVTAIFHIS